MLFPMRFKVFLMFFFGFPLFKRSCFLYTAGPSTGIHVFVVRTNISGSVSVINLINFIYLSQIDWYIEISIRACAAFFPNLIPQWLQNCLLRFLPEIFISVAGAPTACSLPEAAAFGRPSAGCTACCTSMIPAGCRRARSHCTAGRKTGLRPTTR